MESGGLFIFAAATAAPPEVLAFRSGGPRNVFPSDRRTFWAFQPFRRRSSADSHIGRRTIPSSGEHQKFHSSFYCVGYRRPFQSEAKSICRPQRRAGDLTNPFATADAHFAGSSDRRLEPHRTSAETRNIGRRAILPSDRSDT